VKHYHGTSLGGTRESAARFVAAGNRHFLVPYMDQGDLAVVAEYSTGFCFDNSAYTAWRSGKPITNWQGYYDWVNEWGWHPRFDFALIPDVIEGTEQENHQLFAQWFKKIDSRLWDYGCPVWHLHESLEYLQLLCDKTGRVALGSSGQWSVIGSDGWHRRMDEAMRVICDGAGRPRVRIHGLRMLDVAVVARYPFASADSTNVVQNASLLGRFGQYKPPTRAQRAEVIASRIESVNSPAIYTFDLEQPTLF